MKYRVYVCGGNETPGPREACPNVLHNYPLPEGYNDAAEVAGRRLNRGWKQKRCPQCNIYGWIPSLKDVE